MLQLKQKLVRLQYLHRELKILSIVVLVCIGNICAINPSTLAISLPLMFSSENNQQNQILLFSV